MSLARIIDANFNRAREALRVMEDAARFGLDDADLAGLLKGLRHDLRAAVEALPGLDRGHLLASRNTPSDVGTTISTPSETQRTGLPAIVAAAAGRLTEALRCLEEAAKARGTDGRGFESLRYRAYDIERTLSLALGGGRAPQWRLCILITESLCTHHSWEEVARAAIRGGADCIQLREKTLSDRELLARARSLVAIAREAGERRQGAGVSDQASENTDSSFIVHRSSFAPAIIINDRPDIALLARADGVHLGPSDIYLHDARRIVGFGLLIGVSTTNVDQARTAIRDGADYCGLGPMFPTTTKDKPSISGPDYLRRYLGDSTLAATPHLAIGGINPANAQELWASGCRGIAVSSAVCGADDPEAVCRQLVARGSIPCIS